jgi:serine/threonine protein kinase
VCDSAVARFAEMLPRAIEAAAKMATSSNSGSKPQPFTGPTQEFSNNLELAGQTASFVLSEEATTEIIGSIGPYDLLKQIGRGGMGVVYLARYREQPEKLVALKTMTDEAAKRPKLIERFNREALTLARLQHECIVKILSIGNVNGIPFFTMPYVPATLYSERMRFREPRAAAEIMQQISRAIQHAHQNRVQHRDLKLLNVLLDGKDRMTPLVCDFGLAKPLDDDVELTTTGQTMGTAPYMAP